MRSRAVALTNTKWDLPNIVTIVSSNIKVMDSSEETKEAIMKIISPVAKKLKSNI